MHDCSVCEPSILADLRHKSGSGGDMPPAPASRLGYNGGHPREIPANHDEDTP